MMWNKYRRVVRLRTTLRAGTQATGTGLDGGGAINPILLDCFVATLLEMTV
jgi:hypothetical protein